LPLGGYRRLTEREVKQITESISKTDEL